MGDLDEAVRLQPTTVTQSVSGGTIRIDTANNGIKTNGAIRVSSGSLEIQTEDKGLICAEQSIADEAEVSVNGEKITGT